MKEAGGGAAYQQQRDVGLGLASPRLRLGAPPYRQPAVDLLRTLNPQSPDILSLRSTLSTGLWGWVEAGRDDGRGRGVGGLGWLIMSVAGAEVPEVTERWKRNPGA